MHNITIDIETLSTEKDAVVYQIAGICFDPELSVHDPNFFGNSFEVFIDPVGQKAYARVDKSTVAWTQKNNLELFRKAQSEGISPDSAIKLFSEWIEECRKQADGKLKVWANSPSFDCLILSFHMGHHGVEIPWSYREECDARTLVGTFKSSGKFWLVNKATEDYNHDASQDVKRESQEIALCLQYIKGSFNDLYERNTSPRFIELDGKMDFGKHKGKTVRKVLEEDRQYIEFLAGKPGSFQLDDLIKEALK